MAWSFLLVAETVGAIRENHNLVIRFFFVTKFVNPKHIVGANEIAARLKRSHSTIVHAWHSNLRDFPEPIAIVSAGKLWNWKEIEAWAKRTGRLKAKPGPRRSRRDRRNRAVD
jgi:predicted DNA-binding transcriptional regulator AlpA